MPGAPYAKGWKTYHDVLPYDDDDCPASNQGFHCGALLAAKELGLEVTDIDIERAIAGYRSLFNRERGYLRLAPEAPSSGPRAEGVGPWMHLADRLERRITNLTYGHGAMWPHWQPVAAHLETNQ